MGLLRDFFFGHTPTTEDAYRKAEQVGWNIEETGTGYTVHGESVDGGPDTWQYGRGGDDVDAMNCLLDHANSVQIGDEYRRQKWGLEPDEIDASDEWCERKHEVRDYRMGYYEEEYKPGWKRWLGL
jgi:hypothetical protein